ncbi:MAG TPA: hypothetical protein VFG89_02925 [Coriobacteriia bacterium]|nr:hypothetical protein [Coriobacteriia bacterium]
MNRRYILAAGLIALTVTGSLAGGCTSGKQGAVVVTEDTAKNTPGKLTPLERGKIRREAMDDMRDFVAAWKANDADGMRKYLKDAYVKKYEETWAGYTKKGLKIKHVHKVKAFDATQINNTGTQMTVTYTYVDSSYLVDKNGDKVRSLPEVDEDASFTIERKDAKSTDWKIVRMFVAKGSYR